APPDFLAPRAGRARIIAAWTVPDERGAHARTADPTVSRAARVELRDAREPRDLPRAQEGLRLFPGRPPRRRDHVAGLEGGARRERGARRGRAQALLRAGVHRAPRLGGAAPGPRRDRLGRGRRAGARELLRRRAGRAGRAGRAERMTRSALRTACAVAL